MGGFIFLFFSVVTQNNNDDSAVQVPTTHKCNCGSVARIIVGWSVCLVCQW